MSTHQTHFLSEICSGEPIPEGKLAYLRERTKNRFYNFVLKKFLAKEEAHSLTRADLARRIGKRPEVITRLLGAPGNWTLETVSDLLVGICAEELQPQSNLLANGMPRNYREPEWLTAAQSAARVKTESGSSTSAIEVEVCPATQ